MCTTTMDELGRVLIKREIREALSVEQGARFSATVENGAIVLRPCERVCAVCRCSIEDDRELPVCNSCISKIKSM